MNYCVFGSCAYVDKIAENDWIDGLVRSSRRAWISFAAPPRYQASFQEIPMHVLHVPSAKILLWVLIAAILASFSVAQTGAHRHISHLYRTQFSTGEVVSSTWHGAQVQGAKELLGDRRSGWTLIGASVVDRNGIRRLVYSDNSSGALSHLIRWRRGRDVYGLQFSSRP